MVMKPGYDWFDCYYRDRALILQLGVTPYEMFLQSVGAKDDPASAGRQMPSHWGSQAAEHHLQVLLHGDAVPARRRRGRGRLADEPDSGARRGGGLLVSRDEVVYVSGGEGQTSEGEFWEALSSASNLKLPVLFLIEDNGYAISVPVEVNTPGGSISKLVRSFPNLFVAEVDGTDFLESYDALRYAAEYCRPRMGPALVHAHVIRPYSHSLSDDEAIYRPKAEREQEVERDPVAPALEVPRRGGHPVRGGARAAPRRGRRRDQRRGRPRARRPDPGARIRLRLRLLAGRRSDRRRSSRPRRSTRRAPSRRRWSTSSTPACATR